MEFFAKTFDELTTKESGSLEKRVNPEHHTLVVFPLKTKARKSAFRLTV